MAGRSPSTTKTPKVRIRDTASVRVDHASPAQAQSAASVRAPPRPPADWLRVRTCSYAACGAAWLEADVPHRCRRAKGDARRRSMRGSLFVSIIARGTTQCATTLTTRNATRMCKIYVGLPPRTVREPVRPRVTEQCVSSSLHSASRGVARDARQCERQCGLRNPQPIRRLEWTPSIVTKKRPKAVRFGQCEPLPKKYARSEEVSSFFARLSFVCFRQK
jgi:hypothetical protein